ncbi:hypothetical protein EJ05DRAFT_314870 [Pseudovirgaria hyperparasitica]|uniref:EthD domain-containing protein n=1 Tax=Pseudovirgaria hyperparasitica TaxID=470096 RepID=A0A6A6WB64_9PEZI|nr:uncharacterized protein EJ05DRAFT_314870 [Pseudovirgaria hyperparasitica]KAF2759923.1 hypothetical protein EJ05DRAFT_314870 [Pseudovirgaria hyperparasitica]
MYTAMALIWRKPGTTPTFFQTHYDTVHIPLLQRLVGDTFPLTHTRHYVARREPSSPSNQSSPPPGSPPPGSPEQAYPPIILRGTGDPSDPDAYTVMQWRDEGAFRRFMDVFMREEVQAEMRRDEEVFLDTGREKR